MNLVLIALAVLVSLLILLLVKNIIQYHRHKPRHYRFLLKNFSRKVNGRLMSHRGAGAFGKIAENTLPAFEAALEAGFKVNELDMRISRDNVVILFHGPILQETTSGRGRLEKKSEAELARFDWGYYLHKNQGHQPYAMTTLEDYLRAFGHRCLHNFELKRDIFCFNRRLESNVLALVKRFEVAPRVILSSHNLTTLRYLKKRTGMGLALVLRPGPFLRMRTFLYLCFTRPDFVHLPDQKISGKSIRHLAKKGYGLMVYTVNDKKRMHKLFSMGIDMVCTDKLSLIKKF